VTENRYSIDDLVYLMARLRDPDTGCPWDAAQTYATVVPFTLEEVHEVIDTIERQDYVHLREELGDLLFQIIFYCQLAREDRYFQFDDVVQGLVHKLVQRHPHVFPDGTLQSQRSSAQAAEEQQIAQTWEELKKAERDARGETSFLADIPAGMPALVRAQKLQKRAARLGFDWQHLSGVFDKLQEEYAELRDAVNDEKPQAIAEEVGDLLFTCVNLARHLKVDAETALRAASRKFEQRFLLMEEAIAEAGTKLESLDFEAKNLFWEIAKNGKAS